MHCPETRKVGEWESVGLYKKIPKSLEVSKTCRIFALRKRESMAKKKVNSWKTFKYEFGKFMVDIAKLVFGGVILAGIMSQDVDRQLLFSLGSCIVVSFALIGLLIISKNKEV